MLQLRRPGEALADVRSGSGGIIEHVDFKGPLTFLRVVGKKPRLWRRMVVRGVLASKRQPSLLASIFRSRQDTSHSGCSSRSPCTLLYLEQDDRGLGAKTAGWRDAYWV